MASSDCLLARAIPMPAKSESIEKGQIDELVAQFDAAIKLEKKPAAEREKTAETREQRRKRAEEAISPADHLALQSLRSSAMARKTNTTAKFNRDCRNLFVDLLSWDEKAEKDGKKEEKEEKKKKEKEGEEEGAKEEKREGEEEKEEEEKEEEEEETKIGKEEKREGKGDGEGELIARGPIRANFIGHVDHHSFHPYSGAPSTFPLVGHPAASTPPPVPPNVAAAPQSALLDPTSLGQLPSHGYGYECGLSSNQHNGSWAGGWHSGGGGGGRDSVLSSTSSTPDSTGGPDMAQMMMMMSPGGQSEQSELPDDLSDFILEYSRRYSPILSRKASYSEGGSPQSTTGSVVDSPESPRMGTGNHHQRYRAASPRGTAFNGPKSPPAAAPMPTMTKQGSTELAGSRPAKDRLRAMIRSEEMDDALAWTCKCIQRHPGALTFQDADRDTLLHIVASHLDLAKIYALVEQMLKMEVPPDGPAPFDIPNGVAETPLMVAIQKRQIEVVDYLLEAGALPNVQSLRLERDMPLHYAASRGMTDIVRILCADKRTHLDAQNGMGLTPLLCAFKCNGTVEEERQSRLDTMQAAEVLLKAGANPMIGDATNGRTLVHYAVERMDEQMIELLRAHLDEQQLGQLVNQADYCGETPMRALKEMEGLGQAQKAQICLALMTCGADASEAGEEGAK